MKKFTALPNVPAAKRPWRGSGAEADAFSAAYAARETFPLEVDVDGLAFSQTGKLGTNRVSGLPVAEYARGGLRVWAFSDGTLAVDSLFDHPVRS